MRTLLLVSLGMFFENYDIGLLSAALPQISAGLEIAPEDSGFVLGAIRAGGVGSIALMALADGAGRRRVFLGCFVAMSVGTFATALCQTALQFAAAQFLTRIFMLTAAALALVILVEEIPAQLRGGAIGFLSVLGGMGFGLGAGLYALVDHLPFGWRSLYAVGLVPALLLPFFRRALKETRRFEAHAASRASDPRSALARWFEPVALLWKSHPRRAAIVGSAGLFAAMGSIAFGQYTSLFVQTEHGWSPGHYSLLILVGGCIAVLGNVVGGRGSDVFGRRLVGCASLVLAPVCMAAFLLWAQGPAVLGLTWGFASLCTVSASLVIRTVTTELFPTSHRSTAAGWLVLVETVGWTSALLVVGAVAETGADLPGVIAAMAVALVVAAACLSFVPETRRVELETLAPGA